MENILQVYYTKISYVYIELNYTLLIVENFRKYLIEYRPLNIIDYISLSYVYCQSLSNYAFYK